MFKLTHQGAAPEAKSDVYDCLVSYCMYVLFLQCFVALGWVMERAFDW